VKIEFDLAKDATNQTKHGVSLALADELDWEAALVWVDDRFEYGELRMIALAPKTGILYYVAFVDRGKDAKNYQPASSQSSRGNTLCQKYLNAHPS
jgi:hypothetical protein